MGGTLGHCPFPVGTSISDVPSRSSRFLAVWDIGTLGHWDVLFSGSPGNDPHTSLLGRGAYLFLSLLEERGSNVPMSQNQAKPLESLNNIAGTSPGTYIYLRPKTWEMSHVRRPKPGWRRPNDVPTQRPTSKWRKGEPPQGDPPSASSNPSSDAVVECGGIRW